MRTLGKIRIINVHKQLRQRDCCVCNFTYWLAPVLVFSAWKSCLCFKRWDCESKGYWWWDSGLRKTSHLLWKSACLLSILSTLLLFFLLLEGSCKKGGTKVSAFSFFDRVDLLHTHLKLRCYKCPCPWQLLGAFMMGGRLISQLLVLSDPFPHITGLREKP